MNVLSVATELAEALRQIHPEPGVQLRVHEYVPDTIAVPAAFVSFPTITYDAAMGDLDHIAIFEVHVVLSRVSDKWGMRNLAPYLAALGTHSVKAAIEDDTTLNGSVTTVRVTDSRVGAIDVAGQAYLEAAFTVECYSDLTAPDEAYTLTLGPDGTTTGGNWSVTLHGQTALVNHNVTASQLTTSLQTLMNDIGPGTVTATGGPLNTGPFTITIPGDLDAPTASGANLVGPDSPYTVTVVAI